MNTKIRIVFCDDITTERFGNRINNLKELKTRKSDYQFLIKKEQINYERISVVMIEDIINNYESQKFKCDEDVVVWATDLIKRLRKESL